MIAQIRDIDSFITIMEQSVATYNKRTGSNSHKGMSDVTDAAQGRAQGQNDNQQQARPAEAAHRRLRALLGSYDRPGRDGARADDHVAGDLLRPDCDFGAGRKPTYSDIKEAVGDQINRSLHTTYRILLEPSRVYPNGLGWLKQVPNPMDNRVKFLVMTPKGRKVMEEIMAALEGQG
jgi:hypothetical protein